MPALQVAVVLMEYVVLIFTNATHRSFSNMSLFYSLLQLCHHQGLKSKSYYRQWVFVGLVQDPRQFAGMSSYMVTKKITLHPTGPVRGEVGRMRKVKRLMSRSYFSLPALPSFFIHHFISLSICFFLFSPLLLLSLQ